MRPPVLLLTCEHGGAEVPTRYAELFSSPSAQRSLRSHRGCDLGALSLARALQRSLGAPLYASTVTRLLVDLNRSVGHPRLFSELSKKLSAAERAAVLDEHYFPHRDAVEAWIDGRVRKGARVVHVGVHSFAPRMDGRLRTADVGLLYDPSRATERAFCQTWKDALGEIDPDLRVRRNYPYLGKADGFVTYLRRIFDQSRYLGIELEMNQSFLATPHGKRRAAGTISSSLRAITNSAKARPSQRRSSQLERR